MTPLLTRVPSADRQFERMYQRYVGDVYRYALVVLRNPQDAEDVTQTTFMNAYRAMQNGEQPEKPQNWLIAISHNVCRQRFRQAQRRPQESVLYEESIVVDEPDESYSADDLQRALGHLAFSQRAALVMRELEGRSYAEIAAVMGLTVGAVETVIFRARRALREQLEGSVSCDDAERLLSKQLDGELARGERGPLRAHLRECKDCATLARRQRATRGAFKSLLGGLPLPASLLGGGSSVTLGIAAKAAAVVCAGAVVGTGGYEAAKNVEAPAPARAAVRHVVRQASATRPPARVSAAVAQPVALTARNVTFSRPVHRHLVVAPVAERTRESRSRRAAHDGEHRATVTTEREPARSHGDGNGNGESSPAETTATAERHGSNEDGRQGRHGGHGDQKTETTAPATTEPPPTSTIEQERKGSGDSGNSSRSSGSDGSGQGQNGDTGGARHQGGGGDNGGNGGARHQGDGGDPSPVPTLPAVTPTVTDALPLPLEK